ncbi:hypothetical protein [Gordonia sp. AC31]|uniref:hypothetical protein n=1 Tax=Gordonia sp. AC31 TaxID=2962571 RepID=UPI002881490B|nr:hypothetical protein [Gordonia sp. AC31]MDT0223437.1 hypothetical protein [Gordonia sp. AC31]
MVVNPGSIATSSTDRAGLVAPGGSGSIKRFTAIDNRGTPVMGRGVTVDSTTSAVTIDDVTVTGANDATPDRERRVRSNCC